MYQQALKGYERAWGQCIRRCWTQPTPGLFYAEQGKTEEAEAMYQWVLKGNQLTWGPEHTSTPKNGHQHGKSLQRSRQDSSSRDYVLASAEKQKEVAYGPEHAETLDTVNKLGDLYKNPGRIEEAKAMYQRALKGQREGLSAFYAGQRKMRLAENLYQGAPK
ncbi:hypothetical protein MMC22_008894, partial [Lobaria immixta]|nr:hypothetical protein [Lobaria immixta]